MHPAAHFPALAPPDARLPMEESGPKDPQEPKVKHKVKAKAPNRKSKQAAKHGTNEDREAERMAFALMPRYVKCCKPLAFDRANPARRSWTYHGMSWFVQKGKAPQAAIGGSPSSRTLGSPRLLGRVKSLMEKSLTLDPGDGDVLDVHLRSLF